MKKYEAVFILDERLFEDQGKAFSEEVGGFIKSLGGALVETLPMGRRQFARKLKKRKSGIYWDFVFNADEDKIISIRNKYRLDERILRMQVFICEEKKTVSAGSKKLIEKVADEQNEFPGTSAE